MDAHHGDSNASLLELRERFLQSSLTVIRGNHCPICIGSTMGHMLAAEAVRQWRRKLDEGYPFGVARWGRGVGRNGACGATTTKY